MASFLFEALDPKGKEVRGEVEARSEGEAGDKVRKMGYFPTSVKPKGGISLAALPGAKKRRSVWTLGHVSQKQVTQFTRQFATLINAGLPVVRSLDVLVNQQKPGPLRNTLEDTREDVESGSPLSDAMAKHPKVFSSLYTNMVKAGEAGGVLDVILERLADFREKSQKLAREIIGAMVYPAVVLTVATVIIILMLLFMIPMFQKMFEDMPELGRLPVPTLILMSISSVVRDWWFLIPGIPIGLYAIFKLIAANTTGRYVIDSIKLKLPVFGMIIRKSSVSRFCRTLGTLIASGVPILEALSIIKGTTGNAVVARAIGDVHTSIREGDTIAAPLRHSKVFDDLVVNMIDVGEETGELDTMLTKIADNYDNEVDTMVNSMTSVLEPLLIVFMGGGVAFVVISLFLPLIELIKGLGGG